MKKILLAIIAVTFIYPAPIFADSPKFDVQFNTSYKVAQDGNTTVTGNYQIKNRTTEFYAQEYVVNLGNANISQVRANDRNGNIKVTDVSSKTQKAVKVIFSNPPVGKDSVYDFSVTYENADIAKRVGRIWEISIPRPNNLENTTGYTIGLYVPAAFGEIIYQKPTGSVLPNGYIWTQDDLKTNVIMMAFDPEKDIYPYQAYDFRLQYHLYNSRLYPITSEIALPMDTNYQKIFLNDITPRPQDVRVDNDGNWLASYYLGPASRLDIVATGSAAVFLQPILPISTVPNMTDSTAGNQLWNIKDQEIRRQANSLSTPESIYNFVRQYLLYDPGKSKNNPRRQGATAVLANHFSAICLDFTDLFVTLARARGIPAREIEGYAYTNDLAYQPRSLNKDVLHAWPEYYDNGWHAIDPTWANTTGGDDYFSIFDLDHIALAIHSESPTLPYPAGVYRVGETTKDVEFVPVNMALDVNLPTRLGFRADIPKTATAGWIIGNKIFIDNLGPTAHQGLTVNASSGNLDLVNTVLFSGSLPPFSSREIDLLIRPNQWFSQVNGIIELEFGGETRDYPVKILPIYKSKFVLVVGVLLILGIISIIAQITRSLFFQKRARSGDLRR